MSHIFDTCHICKSSGLHKLGAHQEIIYYQCTDKDHFYRAHPNLHLVEMNNYDANEFISIKYNEENTKIINGEYYSNKGLSFRFLCGGTNFNRYGDQFQIPGEYIYFKDIIEKMELYQTFS